MGFFDPWNGISLTDIADPLGSSLGIKGPGTLLTEPWNIGDAVKSDWTAFKHLLVPDMRRDREAQIQTATNARTIIYGRTRVGNTLAYAESSGGQNEKLNLINIFAAHEIDGFEEIFFEDKLVANYSGIQPVGWSGAWIAGAWAIQAPFTGKATFEFFDGTQTVASASMIAASAGGWTANHKLLGLAYLHTTLTYDEGTFPGGLPAIKAVIRGKRVLDTRTNKIAWGSNPAMNIRDFMRMTIDDGGMGCDPDEMDEDLCKAAADICDQIVYSNIPPNQAPGVKTLYKPIAGSDPTYPETRYTLNGIVKLDGAPTKFVKDMLTAMAVEAVYTGGKWKFYAGAGSAPVATINESWLNGGISFQTGANSNDKSNTGKGTFTNSNDFWADTEFPEVPVGISTPPKATYWAITATPSYYDKTLTYPQNSYCTLASKVYQAYSSASVPADTPPPESSYWILVEEHDNSLPYPTNHKVQRGGVVYTSTTSVPVSNPYLAEDSGQVLSANLTLPYTITSSEAQRLAKIVVEKSRRGFTLAYPCNHRAFKIDVMDVVTIENSLMGISGDFRVTGWSFSLMGGISLQLAEYDPAIYNWVPGDSTPLIAPVLAHLPDPWTVVAPTGLAVIESLYTGNVPSVVMSRATFSWTAGGASSTIYDVWLDDLPYATNYRDTTIVMPDMTPGLHTFTVRASNTLGSHSAPISMQHGLIGNADAPANVSSFTATFSGNLVNLKWTANSDADLASYEIRVGSSWAAGALLQLITATAYSYRPTGSGAYTYWICALDTTGNYSATAATASITVPAADVPTALATTAQFLAIDVAVTYDTTRADTAWVEIWAATTNNRAVAVQVGITHDGRWQMQGLNNAASRHFWVRCVSVFGANGAWYPASASAGVFGAALNDPTQALKLLNANIGSTDLDKYLNGTIPLLSLLDVGSVAFTSQAALSTAAATILDGLQRGTAGVIAHGGQIEAVSAAIATQGSTLTALNATVAGLISNDYDPAVAYTLNRYVRYTDGIVYRCILETTAGTIPTNTTYWEPASSMLTLLAAAQHDIDTLNGEITSKVDTVVYNVDKGALEDATSLVDQKADRIDSKVAATTIAFLGGEIFDATRRYAVNDVVMSADLQYRCIVAIPDPPLGYAPAADATHWLNVPVSGRMVVAESRITQNSDSIDLAAETIVGPLAFAAAAATNGASVFTIADLPPINARVSRVRIKADSAAADILLESSRVDVLTGRVSQAEIDIDGANAAISLRATLNEVDALTGVVTTKAAQIDLDAANAAIVLRATHGDLSGEVAVLADMIGLKLNANGTVGPGMAIGWNDTHTKSIIRFNTDTFQVGDTDGSGYRNIFSVGNINGTPAVGVSGDMVIDGSVSANSLIADTAMVTFLNARNITAGSVKAENIDVSTAKIGSAQIGSIDAATITSGVITSRTIQTAATGERFIVDVDSKAAHFYDSSDTEQVWIGTATAEGYETDNWHTYGRFGTKATGNTKSGIVGMSNSGVAVVGYSYSGTGIYGSSCFGYGAKFGVVVGDNRGNQWTGMAQDATKGAIVLGPATQGSPDPPTHAAVCGTLWVTYSGVLYINTTSPIAGEGTTWQKVGSQ